LPVSLPLPPLPRRSRELLPALAFLAPATVVLAAVVALPIGYAFWLSLHRWNLLAGDKRWTGLGNYIAILTDPATLQTVRLTLWYSGLSVALQLLLGMAVALLLRAGLRRGIPGFRVFRVLILVPLLVAPLLWAFYFRSFYSPQFGLFNAVLQALGLPAVLWVNDPALALYSLVLADVWQWTPFMVAILLAGLLALPTDIVEAARVDGAGRLATFFHIELPLLRRVVIVAVVMRVIDSLRYLDLVLVITQGGPGTSTEILNYLAYRTAFQEFQIGKGAALAFVVFALVLAAAIVVLRTLRNERHAG
jgi:ABC-type sugar transport system permease subunit